MRSAVIVAAAVAMGARAVLAASMTGSTSLAGVHTNATSAAIARPTGHIEDDEECDEDDDEPTGSVTRWTTSTISATKVITVTSCAPTVTNCPSKPYVTTTVVLETTVCPVTEAVPTWTTSAASKWTTSTIYNTKVLTVTSCPPTVTNCPNKPYVTTTVEIETTVCPVTEGHPATWTKGPYPSGSAPAWSAPAGTGAWSATTKTAGVAVGTGKPVTSGPVPAQTTAPITAGASKAVFGLGAAVAAVVAFL